MTKREKLKEAIAHGCEWLAQDSDGAWWSYKYRPVYNCGEWSVDNGTYKLFTTPVTKDPSKTLRKFK